MSGILTVLALLATLAHAPGPAPGPTADPAPEPTVLARTPDPAALSVIDTAIARMGGAEALRGIERVRLEMMTQWQLTSFEARPFAEHPSYERHVELRDYGIPAWRNTRRWDAGERVLEVTDVVRDTVAIRHMGERWSPLNVAYVDEMRELFTFAPERVLLLAREAEEVRLLGDTAIAGAPHARVAVTLEGFPSVLFLDRGTGLLTMVRYRAAHPSDFGLVAWGEMEVETWFAQWRSFPEGVSLPMQRDVRRVGRPYKRMTVLSATLNPPAAPDSFAVSASLRSAFFATANRPMHDLPLDSARIVDERFAWFRTPGSPAGAVRLGERWLLLEAGVAPLSLERALEWLERTAPGAKPAVAVVTATAPGNGGVVSLVERGLPMLVGSGAAPFVRAMLRNHRLPTDGIDVVSEGRWLEVDGDSVRVEPIDLPNARGATLVYVPSLHWLYVAMATTPFDIERALAHARERGWTVERIGTLRTPAQPVPTT